MERWIPFTEISLEDEVKSAWNRDASLETIKLSGLVSKMEKKKNGTVDA